MGKRLSSILVIIALLTTFSIHTTFAEQSQNNATFFSFIKNYVLAFTAIDSYNKHVLAAHTTSQSNQFPHPTQQQNVSLSDVSSYLLEGVNDYRKSRGLSPVQASAQTCAFALTRAKEIATKFNHAAFYTRVNNHTIAYTNWARATENIAEAPDYKEVVTLWEDSPEHAANMRDNTPYVCIMQSGNYYAYEGMRS